VEERGILHPPGSTESAKGLFSRGYSLKRLRDKAVRRSAHDRNHDQWEGLRRVWLGLAEGEPRLALPALGGLFTTSQCPALDSARLENRHLLAALFHLAWLREAPGEPLTRVNWRDMGSEELGSIYESLLELTPQLAHDNRHFSFLEGAATKGNARKTSGSYYTPDSLVQELLDSALEPVVAERLAPHGGTLASGEAAAHALLSITVCDPACGSGHFILAAARRLATHLARVQTEGGQPTPDDYRHALRQVVTHCIHGVDLNPMAVELTKIALWLEAYTPDAPLGFIDHHIRCGDALLGVLDPAILANGIPDKAFNALSGDDKEVVKALKKANKDALKSIAKIQREGHMPNWQEAVAQSAVLETLPDDTLAAVEAKRAAFTETEAVVSQSRARIAADLFVAAFVLPKTPQNKDFIPTSQDLWLVMNGEVPRAGVREAAAQAANSVQALHWWQAFPQIRAKDGFDVLLGNPPWERIKLQEEEYFASRSEQIATAQHKAERGRLIAELGEADEGSSERRLYDEFIIARRVAEAASLYAHDSGRYPLTGVGDINTYALFAETFVGLTSIKGGVGIIVPSGIATDDSTKHFFGYLIQSNRLASLLSFENEEFIFPGIANVVRFALLTLQGPSETRNPAICFYLRNIQQLAEKERIVFLQHEDYALFNPNSFTAPIFRSNADYQLTKRLFQRFPLATVKDGFTTDAWDIHFMRMFDMASDSKRFISKEKVKELKNANTMVLPLYEGKFVWHFDHRFGSYHNVGKEKGRGGRGLPLTKLDEYENPEFVIEPEYWVLASDVEQRVSLSSWNKSWFLGFRDVTSAKLERTFVSTIVPYTAIGHKLPVMFPRSEPRDVALLQANLAALVFDYIARQKIGGTSMTYAVVKQLPVLNPSYYSESDRKFILPRVLELTYTAHDLHPWAEDLGYNGPPFIWNPERRALLRAELDAYYAKLYCLTRDELRYILDPEEVMGADYPSETFRVLKINETREFGEYRTRRLVLREFDRMVLADVSGETYQSLLVPPPGQQSSPQYSSIGVIRDEKEARMAGLVLALIRQAGSLPRQHLTFALAALQNEMPATDAAPSAADAQLSTYRQLHSAMLSDQPARLQSVLRFFETSGAIRIQQQGTLIESIADALLPNGVIVEPDAEAITGILLRIARAGLEQQAAEAPGTASQPATKQA
jgi:hypothetical protein